MLWKGASMQASAEPAADLCAHFSIASTSCTVLAAHGSLLCSRTVLALRCHEPLAVGRLQLSVLHPLAMRSRTLPQQCWHRMQAHISGLFLLLSQSSATALSGNATAMRLDHMAWHQAFKAARLGPLRNQSAVLHAVLCCLVLCCHQVSWSRAHCDHNPAILQEAGGHRLQGM